MAKLLKSDGTETQIKPKEGSKFQLNELQDYVDGYIEIIEINSSDIMIVNEEGKMYNKPYNKLATQIFIKSTSNKADYIVGDAVICAKKEVE